MESSSFGEFILRRVHALRIYSSERVYFGQFRLRIDTTSESSYFGRTGQWRVCALESEDFKEKITANKSEHLDPLAFRWLIMYQAGS